jgi:DNA primase
VLLRVLLSHPRQVAALSEEIAALDFPEPELDQVRRQILQMEVLHPGLDAAALRQHLERHGLATTVDRLMSPAVDHAGFLSSDADDEAARLALLHVLKMIREEDQSDRISAADALAREVSAENWERYLALRGSDGEPDIAAEALLTGRPGER